MCHKHERAATSWPVWLGAVTLGLFLGEASSLQCACCCPTSHLVCLPRAWLPKVLSIISMPDSFCRYKSFISTNQEPRAFGWHPHSGRANPQSSHSCTSERHLPACTGLGQFSPPSPRCGGHLEERQREGCYRVPQCAPRKRSWCRQTRPRDSCPLSRGATARQLGHPGY